MKIIIATGTSPAHWAKSSIEYWMKRINQYANVDIRRFRGDEKRIISSMVKLAMQSKLPIALTRVGDLWDSQKWQKNIAFWQNTNLSPVFFVGSADGLPQEILDICDTKISLSPLTFQHDLALIILLEQLYRHFSALAGHPYHRGK